MALDLGCGRGHIAKHMNSDIVGTLYQCDVAEHMVVSDPYQEQIRDTCMELCISRVTSVSEVTQ